MDRRHRAVKCVPVVQRYHGAADLAPDGAKQRRNPFESSAGTDVVFMTLGKDLGMRREIPVKIVDLQDREVVHVHSVRIVARARNVTMPEAVRKLPRRTTWPAASSTRTVGIPRTP